MRRLRKPDWMHGWAPADFRLTHFYLLQQGQGNQTQLQHGHLSGSLWQFSLNARFQHSHAYSSGLPSSFSWSKAETSRFL
jgi:hypothetical protein